MYKREFVVYKCMGPVLYSYFISYSTRCRIRIFSVVEEYFLMHDITCTKESLL